MKSADIETQCAEFNAKFPVGSAVSVRKDGGEIVNTTTRSAASVLSGHSAVIWLDGIDGISGYYLLDRVVGKAMPSLAASPARRGEL